MLLLGSVLLVCASCTIERMILYNTRAEPLASRDADR